MDSAICATTSPPRTRERDSPAGDSPLSAGTSDGRVACSAGATPKINPVTTEIASVKMESYIAWMKSAYYISATGNPAMSVPCAFSNAGLPIGIQIVGRHHDDWGVLQLGYAFEQATNVGKRRPGVV